LRKWLASHEEIVSVLAAFSGRSPTTLWMAARRASFEYVEMRHNPPTRLPPDPRQG
jgi:hypothetical protein